MQPQHLWMYRMRVSSHRRFRLQLRFQLPLQPHFRLHLQHLVIVERWYVCLSLYVVPTQYTRLRTVQNKVAFFLPHLPELNYNNPVLTVEKIEIIPTIFVPSQQYYTIYG